MIIRTQAEADKWAAILKRVLEAIPKRASLVEKAMLIMERDDLQEALEVWKIKTVITDHGITP
jgi:hypothetical protein